MSNDYAYVVPDAEYISTNFNYMLTYWQPRNKFIFDMRKMLVGENTIIAPASHQYKVRTMHTYFLASILNDKVSRFMDVPEISVIPDDEMDKSRSTSTELEMALSSLMYEIERRGDGDVWSRVITDAILIDMGVERIERAPAAFWPELMAKDENGKPKFVFEDEGRDLYKKEHGVPVRTKYVPLENFFPSFELNTLMESYEVEFRSLRSVLRNPLFSSAALRGFDTGSKDSISQQVTILHHVNLMHHSYWLLGVTSGGDMWPKVNLQVPQSIKGMSPVLLHSYEHKLGESLYNCVAGRYGGWKSQENRIEGIGKGILELNQKADDLMSQVITNIGATFWPNNGWKIDPELRGHTNGTAPKPPQVQEGETVIMFKGEEFGPLVEPKQDETVPWVMQQLKDQLSRLGGSVATLGMNEPGVYTGYHQQLNITQAEHMDEKIEQHLSQGAIQRTTKILKHIIAMDETCFTHYTTYNDKGSKIGRYARIEPSQLRPMPKLDARIRKPRPIDFVASLRAAADASNEREGKGPLLSDDTILEEILGRSSPDIERRKVLVQAQKTKLINSGEIDRLIAQTMNLKIAKLNTPQVTADQIAQADPALAPAMQVINANQAPDAGGVDPKLLAAQIGGAGTSSGMPPGASQPESQVGDQVKGASQDGEIIGQ